jgi:glycosyltransferase involved in cell wall biosynthesis
VSSPAAADGERPDPILVARVDVDRALPRLSPLRGDGTRYSHALLHLYRAGIPVGQREIPLGDAPLPPAELAAVLGDAPASRPEPDSARDTPFISVVVPTVMQRGDLLDGSIAALAALDYPDFEVIVVDNRPDGSAARAHLHDRLRRHDRVTVVSEAYPGISAARNTGLRHARGEIVAFTDDDAAVDPRWLAAIARRMSTQPAPDCVTGLVLPAELETPAQIWFERSGGKVADDFELITYRREGAAGRWSAGRYSVVARRGAGSSRVPIYRAKFGMGANMAFRTAVLRELGGFDEALGTGTVSCGGEDIVMLSRLLYAGGTVAFDPAVVVHHYHRRDDEALLAQMHGYGVGYTAALTALVRTDPRHLIGLAHLVVPALRLVLHRSAERSRVSYPARFVATERRGLLAGPARYLRARRALRRAGRPPVPAVQPATVPVPAPPIAS